MFLRVGSDFHLEAAGLLLPELPDEKHDILILAGDIGNIERPHTYEPVKKWIPRFRHTIMIFGNHEYYHGSYPWSQSKIDTIFKDEIAANKFSYGDNKIVKIDDVSFILATLWTDYDKHNPTAMWSAQQSLNDFRLIRTGPKNEPYKHKVKPGDFYTAHKTSVKFIFDNIQTEKANQQKVCVVTHHGPSEQSIHAMYKGDPLNSAYVSALDNQIFDTQPELWVHGHTHCSFAYKIGNTQVLVNPRGYAYRDGSNPENKEFNPLLRVEI